MCFHAVPDSIWEDDIRKLQTQPYRNHNTQEVRAASAQWKRAQTSTDHRTEQVTFKLCFVFADCPKHYITLL